MFSTFGSHLRQSSSSCLSPFLIFSFEVFLCLNTCTGWLFQCVWEMSCRSRCSYRWTDGYTTVATSRHLYRLELPWTVLQYYGLWGLFFLKISVYAQVGTVLGQHLVLMSCSIFMWMKTEGILILRWTRWSFPQELLFQFFFFTCRKWSLIQVSPERWLTLAHDYLLQPLPFWKCAFLCFL